MADRPPIGVPYWRRVDPALPLGECELLSELEQVTLDPADIGSDEGVRLNTIVYPFVLVVSQDCDLEWDDDARRHLETVGPALTTGEARVAWDRADKDARTKLMDGILVCVAEEQTLVRDSSGLPSKQWQFAQSNQHERYHFLRPGTAEVDLDGVGFPALVLDFKRYFSVPSIELRRRAALAGAAPGRAHRRSVLGSPYLEDVAARFFSFQARVALPDEGRAG